MLDGRIDTQGTVKDLKEQGVLEGIEHDTAVDAHKEQIAAAEATIAEEGADVNATKVASDDDMTTLKKPRKLVKDEHRETGGVKWSIYKSYLEASCVIFLQYQSHLFLTFDLFQFVLDLGVPRLPRGAYSNSGCFGEALD
jgi:carbamoylphosphate synthase small subunit